MAPPALLPPRERPGMLDAVGGALAAVVALLAVFLSNRALAVVAVVLAAFMLARRLFTLNRAWLDWVFKPVIVAVDLATRPLAVAVKRLVKAVDDLKGKLRQPPGSSRASRLPAWLRGGLAASLGVLAWLALTVALLVVFALGVFVVSGILGAALAGKTQPIAVEWLYLGTGLTVAVLLIAIAFVVAAFGSLVWWPKKRIIRRRTCVWIALVPVLGLLAYMSVFEVPGELSGANAAKRGGGGRPVDVLVVVDPADSAGRDYAQFVRRHVRTFAEQRVDALPFNVAFALAAPSDPALTRTVGPWALIEPPTTDRRHFAESVAVIAPRDSPPATDRYTALLSLARADAFVRWRRTSRRSVVLILGKLPLAADLDAGAGRDPAPSWAAVRAMYAADPDVRLIVATSDARADRLRLWRDWLEDAHGQLVTFEPGAFDLPDDIEDAATGSPVSGIRLLARRFSPHLLFDSKEKFFPVDVDDLFAKSATERGHQVCDHTMLADDCQPLHEYEDLLTSLDEYIDFEGGARLGKDLEDRDTVLGVRNRIYVDAVPHGAELQLNYWWFQRYNVSPWASDRNCLPGLTVTETTCFDHEGDWEGVTVTLRSSAGQDTLTPYAPEHWRLDSVAFSSHKFVTRWQPDQVQLTGPFDTHVVVYVAQGSHASYPTRCLDACTQKLAGSGVPEGDFDGAIDWSKNSSACCLPLPETPSHDGALWNAFPGRWGKAVCTVVVKVCSQSDGPLSPSRQPRAAGRTFAGQDDALERHRRRYGQTQVAP